MSAAHSQHVPTRHMLPEKLRPIHASLVEINRRLDTIEEHYGNLKGITKEIDEIRGEVRANSEASRHREEDRGMTPFSYFINGDAKSRILLEAGSSDR